MKFVFDTKIKKYLFFLSLPISTLGAVLAFNKTDQFYISVIVHLSMATLYFLYAVFVFWLSDKYFNKRNYVNFFLFYFLASCLIAFFCSLTELRENYIIGFSGNLIGVFFVSGFALILRYSKHKIDRRVELQEYKAALQQAEIKLLKEQLNPHFLFNTLNSIHYNCLVQPQKASEMIMQLSDLLRYQLDTVRNLDVKLDDEVGFINNYIEFEKNRIPENVQFDYENNIEKSEYRITPSVLITLVENAFKHFTRDIQNPFIHIHLSRTKNIFCLKTVNSFVSKNSNLNGTSMKNLIQRLEFMYENRYSLEILEDQSQISITLTIEL